METFTQKPKSPIIDIAQKLDNQRKGFASRNNLDKNKITPECAIHIQKENSQEKETIFIKEIKNLTEQEEIKAFEKCVALLQKTFKDDQLYDPSSFKRNFEGITKYGKERPKYNFLYAINEKGEIVGVRVSEQLQLKSINNETINNETIFYAVYIAVKEEYREKGIGKEMVISALVKEAEIASSKNQEIKFITAECSDITEKLQNSIGLKRVYFKENDNSLKEMEFKQPIMEFDKDGNPTSKESKEHFMICKLNDEPTTKEDIIKNIFTLYKQYEASHPLEYFLEQNNQDEELAQEALAKYQNYFEKLRQEIIEQINSQGEVVLLTQEERKEQTLSGINIKDYETLSPIE